MLDASLPPLHSVLSRVTHFCKIFEQTVYGNTNKSFTHNNQALYEQFKRNVDVTAPRFIVSWGAEASSPGPNVITMEEVRKAIREYV